MNTRFQPGDTVFNVAEPSGFFPSDEGVPVNQGQNVNHWAPAPAFETWREMPQSGIMGPYRGQQVPIMDGLNIPYALWKNPNETQSTKGRRLVSNLFSLLVYGLCLALIAGSIIFAFSNNTNKSLFGYRFYNVLTTSMKPVFEAGDMIFIKRCELNEIRENDIVTFVPSASKPESYLTHRVMEIIPGTNGEPPKMITKGDLNNANDPPVSTAAVVGVYQFHIPKMGYIIQFVRDNLPITLICLISTFGLLILLRSYFAEKKEVKTIRRSVHPS